MEERGGLLRLLDFILKVRPSYVPDFPHEVMCAAIDQALSAEEPDLLCSAPPGTGKTELFGILLPAFLVYLDPGTHIISLANSDSLARLASSNILRLVQSPQFQELCPLELDKATETTFTVRGNDGRPTVHSAGIKGQLTGHRANFLLYDDLTKSLSDAWSETVRESTWSNYQSAAETRLLPGGKVFGIQTRWTLDDTHGRNVARAQSNPQARQFRYLNLAATNNGAQSFVLDTRSGERRFFAPYPSLATKPHQPYSFSPSALKGKAADLGPVIFEALYQGNPVAQEGQMFPPEVWGKEEAIDTSEYTMIVTAWDTASKEKASSDPSANVVVGRRRTGDFVVLDYVEFKLPFDRLLSVVIERDRRLAEQFGMLPLLVIEDASSGMALLDVVRSQFPAVPLLASKPIKSKIVRAEAVTPFTTARSVKLLRGEWNGQFIADLANFPSSDRDHSVDAFTMAMRTFTGTGSDFKKPEWSLSEWKSEYESENDMEAACGTLMLGESVLRGPEDF
jgi:predicted phage terminase large subunit-like protein